MSEVEAIKEDKPVFIPKKRKPLRKRRASSDENSGSEEESIRTKLEEMKTLQRLRERPYGVSTITLALGEKVSVEEETLLTDPFKVKTGGLVNMSSLKTGRLKANEDDAYDTGIGTQFSAETNKRDEDEEMMKYIEVELSKRKGRKDREGGGGGDDKNNGRYCSPEEAALQAVPDHLRASSAQRSEEMLSNQMLSGIPEVDLGIEAKIRNIEATEEAKLRLLWEKHNKKDGPSQFVPTNMAVNFVQHNRFNIEETGPPRKRDRMEHGGGGGLHQKPAPPGQGRGAAVQPAVPTNRKPGGRDGANVEKATDDYHYEKFKKQFRRY